MNDVPAVNSVLPPPWSVIEFTFSDFDADAELVVMCNNTQVLKTETATLHDFLYAPIQEYTLEAKPDNKLVLRPRKGHVETGLMFGVAQADSKGQLWPGYLPSEIKLDEEAAYDSIPRRVILPDGTLAFFKLMGRGDKSILDKELRSYEKARSSGLPSSVRISRLLGLVKGESGTVFGLLLTHIDCNGQTLTCAVESGAPGFLRRQWIADITQIVLDLHQHGLVWGDAKPDNVLIDGNKNAWVIDFGGGYTEGWVPKSLAGTVKGDLTGLTKIVDYVESGTFGSM